MRSQGGSREGWSSRREKSSRREGEAKERRSEDGERLPVFEKSGSGVYQKLTVHSQSRNTGQEWSEVNNDGLMFRTVYVRWRSKWLSEVR